MTGSLCHFILSFFLFVGSHFWLLSIAVRARLLAVFELKHFLALYSIILIILFARVLLAYGDAIEVMVWDPLLGFKHVSLTLMLFACLSIVRGHTTQNPAALKTSRKFFDYSPKGICKITRHPILWSGAFWGLSHVFASGIVRN
jgi:uncharacterized membrane protein